MRLLLSLDLNKSQNGVQHYPVNTFSHVSCVPQLLLAMGVFAAALINALLDQLVSLGVLQFSHTMSWYVCSCAIHFQITVGVLNNAV